MKKIKLDEKKAKTLKKGLAITAGIGAGIIASRIIKNHMGSEPLRIYQRVAVTLGSFALAGIVSEAAEKYTTELIDLCEDIATKVKEKIMNKDSEEIDVPDPQEPIATADENENVGVPSN